MKTRKALSLGLLMTVLGLFVSGCASTESDNVSTRPWNTPRGWEYGMPGMDRMR